MRKSETKRVTWGNQVTKPVVVEDAWIYTPLNKRNFTALFILSDSWLPKQTKKIEEAVKHISFIDFLGFTCKQQNAIYTLQTVKVSYGK
jgi:hypothetical protein